MLEVQLNHVAFATLIAEDDEVQQTPILLDMISTYFTSVYILIVNETTVISHSVSCFII